MYPAAARPAVIEFFVMLGVSCCNIFIFTYAVLQGYANPSFFMVVAALSMTVSNLASGRLLRPWATELYCPSPWCSAEPSSL